MPSLNALSVPVHPEIAARKGRWHLDKHSQGVADVQGPIYKAIEWLDHEGMDLIEQVIISGLPHPNVFLFIYT